MSGTATITPKHLLKEGTPAEIRDALTPEDQERFDTSFRRALDTAARTFTLDELDACLAHWRRTAASQAHMGYEAWRAMLAKADRILATGEPTPGSRPWSEVKAELAL